MRCHAFTAAGTQCKREAIPGTERCGLHKRVEPNEDELVATVVGAAQVEWRAAAWILERRFPERWTRRGGSLEPAVEEGFDSLDELAQRRDVRRQQ